MTGLRTMSGKPYLSPTTDSGKILSRQNWAPNPDFEVNTGGWAASGGPIISVSTEWARRGTTSLKAVGGTTSGDVRLNGSQNAFFNGLAPGKTFTFSAYVYTPAAHISFNTGVSSRQRRILFWYSVNGAQYLESFGPQGANIAGVQRLSHTFTVPANASGALLGIGTMGSSTDANFVTYIDSVLLEETAVLGEYFDGSSPSVDNRSYSWTGVSQASWSLEHKERKITLLIGSQPKEIRKILPRTNLALNPRFLGNPIMWAVANGSLTADTLTNGTPCAKLTPITTDLASGATIDYGRVGTGVYAAVVPGKTYTYSFIGESTISGQVWGLLIRHYDSAGVQKDFLVREGDAPLVANVPKTWSKTMVAPVGAEKVRLVWQLATGTIPVGSAAKMTNVLVEETSELKPYFDGSTSNDVDYLVKWSGEPNNSISLATP